MSASNSRISNAFCTASVVPVTLALNSVPSSFVLKSRRRRPSIFSMSFLRFISLPWFLPCRSRGKTSFPTPSIMNNLTLKYIPSLHYFTYLSVTSVKHIISLNYRNSSSSCSASLCLCLWRSDSCLYSSHSSLLK